MSRSNAPLALSVVSLTEPDDVAATLQNITQFDDRPFGFNHERTWGVLPKALRGIFEPASVGASLPNVPVRVGRCIVALCTLGKELQLNTRAFVDYPSAGLRTATPIEWDPDVVVRVKGSCWFVQDERPWIPLLQPRKAALSDERLSVYVRLGKQAFCQGDWVEAGIKLIDLSGEGDTVEARMIDESDISPASDAVLARYVKTFVDAKREADRCRSEQPKEKKPVELPMGSLLDIKR